MVGTSRALLLPESKSLLESELSEFDAESIGVVESGDAETFEFFVDWLKQGNHAAATYLEKNVDARKSPRSILPDVRSLIVCAVPLSEIAAATDRVRNETVRFAATNSNRSQSERNSNESTFEERSSSDQTSPERTGAILFYATSLDYHNVVREKLKRLQKILTTKRPDWISRAVVDTAPLLEKEWASRAGIGFVGRHSLLIRPRCGSRCFLGTLLISAPIDELRMEWRSIFGFDPKRPQKTPDGCRDCRRCLDVCPTGAILPNRTLDLRRCLNYWTIEDKGDEIPEEIRKNLGDRLFGCDLCQRVCPWNRDEERWRPTEVDLTRIENLSDSEFQQAFGKTPVARLTNAGLKRNARRLNDR